MLGNEAAPRRSSSPMRRRLQWTVRGMLLLTTTCAVATLLVLTPRVREREAIEWLEEKGASIEIEPIGPNWLRKVLGDRYLQCVASADLRGCEFSDADLARLSPLRHLRNLELLGTQVTIDGVERMAGQWHGIYVDVLFAETLYRSAETECLVHQRPFYETIVECQTAARWKSAWADSRGGPGDRIAARRQFIDGLHRCASALNESGKSMTPLDQAMFEAALAEGRIELAEVSQSESVVAAARRDGEAAGNALVRRLDGAIAAAIDPLEFDTARELATRLLLESRSAGEEAVDAANILADAAQQTELLALWIKPLYYAGKQGGEAEKMSLCLVDLALVRARLAHVRGDRASELHALQSAANDAAELCEAAKSAYDAGTLSTFDLLIAHRRAAELELEFARAHGDRTAEQAARERWLAFLDDQIKRVVWGPAIDLSFDESHRYLVFCRYTLSQYEEQLDSFFDQPVITFIPSGPIATRRSKDRQMAGDETVEVIEDAPGEPNGDFELLPSERYEAPE